MAQSPHLKVLTYLSDHEVTFHKFQSSLKVFSFLKIQKMCIFKISVPIHFQKYQFPLKSLHVFENPENFYHQNFQSRFILKFHSSHSKSLHVSENPGKFHLQNFRYISPFKSIRVFEIKKVMLDIATAAASGATTFFIIIGLFSVMVGILLIFLIFVMLAAARRTEMGMTRAIGAKSN